MTATSSIHQKPIGKPYNHCNLPTDLQDEVKRAVVYKIGCTCGMSHGCPTQVIHDPKIRNDILPLKTYFNSKQISARASVWPVLELS